VKPTIRGKAFNALCAAAALEGDVVDRTPFPLCVQVRDIGEARRFYQGVLGCVASRCDERRLNFNLYGHPFVCHLDPQLGRQGRTPSHYDPVAGKFVPLSHRAVVLETQEWTALAERLLQHHAACEPSVCFRNTPLKQAALCVRDPSGNALEFKSSRIVAIQLVRRQRKKALKLYAPWAILCAFIWCWILLHAKRSVDELAAGKSVVPVPVAFCANSRSCAPSY
jgi:extradiol dioxygenase family protein